MKTLNCILEGTERKRERSCRGWKMVNEKGDNIEEHQKKKKKKCKE